MNLPNKLLYPDELSRFLADEAALLDAQQAEASASPSECFQPAHMRDGVTPMPPEFQLAHPRRIRFSGLFTQPDGSTAHYTGFQRLTPEDEAGYRLSDPENGLHPDDLKAYRKSQRGPVAKFFARLKFWP
jgi:hypothetical protein